MKQITLSTLKAMTRQAARKSPCSPATTPASRALLEGAGVDVLLVGDSLGMVLQGHDSTLPVTLDDMVYHTALRGARREAAPSSSPTCRSAATRQARNRPLRIAARLMAAGAQMVKLEGGAVMVETVRVPDRSAAFRCARHIGLTPQSVHQLGGYRVQGKGDAAPRNCSQDARALEAGRRRHAGAGSDAGAAGAAEITAQLTHSHHRHRRRRRTAPARCWCCTTCSASIRGKTAEIRRRTFMAGARQHRGGGARPMSPR